ncbi:MAG: CDP-diacylglycerol--serine O-phosphatidyltransferase [Hyphomicrobiales bacterium]|nr:CDP-diacylglycerol--serine O-phosphatidyltransferase [Hyphomicrobiales bacterium]OQW81506.1 MAG: CDP-diacylglycerol--serine O-phosphatidyltransferase [Proteobacteria bacterium ST_bin15]
MNEDIPQKPPLPRRFVKIPVRVLAPNLVTLLALCSGLTAIRLSIEGKVELALIAVIFAAILDGIDGRLARLLKGTSKFGAELDSLTDFVNFGVAPALILYSWLLVDIRNAGWIAALVFAIAAALRLARFNVQLDDPTRPAWAAGYFTGIPAPAGAITVLLPAYLVELGLPKSSLPPLLVALYVLFIAWLMVSQLPTYSGKGSKLAVGREWVMLVLLGVALFIGLLVAYTWEVMALSTIIYLAMIPLSIRSHRRLKASDAASKAP